MDLQTIFVDKVLQQKVGEHIVCGCSMSVIWKFDRIENKHTLYRRNNCMRNFCESLREYTKNITNFEKNKNVTVQKRKTKITSRWKSMFYLWKKNLKKSSLNV